MKKSFENVEKYEQEIRQLVPGYSPLHAVWAPSVQAQLKQDSVKALLVGCGTGAEVVALAQVAPQWTIEALDSSLEMVNETVRAVDRAGVRDRVRIRHSSLEEASLDGDFDVAASILVGHLIADDGGRKTFIGAIADSLRDGGVAMIAEIENADPNRKCIVEAHVDWAAGQGIVGERAELLRERLLVGFHTITAERQQALCLEQGLHKQFEFFRCLDVVGRLYCKNGHTKVDGSRVPY